MILHLLPLIAKISMTFLLFYIFYFFTCAVFFVKQSELKITYIFNQIQSDNEIIIIIIIIHYSTFLLNLYEIFHCNLFSFFLS